MIFNASCTASLNRIENVKKIKGSNIEIVVGNVSDSLLVLLNLNPKEFLVTPK